MNDEKNFEIPAIFIFPMSKLRAGKFKMIYKCSCWLLCMLEISNYGHFNNALYLNLV